MLAVASARPTRVSELLALARDRADEVADNDRLLDVLWGAALWVFVTGDDRADDERPTGPDLAAAVAVSSPCVTSSSLTTNATAARISHWLDRSLWTRST